VSQVQVSCGNENMRGITLFREPITGCTFDLTSARGDPLQEASAAGKYTGALGRYHNCAVGGGGG
jgi:hypothetical protein